MSLSQVGSVQTKKLIALSRPNVWFFRGTTQGLINMVYIVEVKYGQGGWFAVTGMLRQPAEIETGLPYLQFRVDVTQIVVDYVGTEIRQRARQDVPGKGGGVQYYAESHVEYRIRFGEEVWNSSTSSLELVEPNTSLWRTSVERYGIDAAIQHEETEELDQDEFMDGRYWTYHLDWNMVYAPFQASHELRFLTNKPNHHRRTYSPAATQLNSHGIACPPESGDDSEYVSVFASQAGTYCYANIVRDNGTTHTAVQISDKIKAVGVNQIGVGLENIKSYWTEKGNINSYWTAGNGIKTIVYYIATEDTPESSLSEYRTVHFKKGGCDDIRIYWKNRKGGIDGWTFDGSFRKSQMNSYGLFTRALGYRLNDAEYLANNNVTFVQESGGTNKTNLYGKKSLQITTRHLNQEYMHWLGEIATSPLVWIENHHYADGVKARKDSQTWSSVHPDGYSKHVPVIVTNMETEVKPIDKPNGQMTFMLHFANDIVTQRSHLGKWFVPKSNPNPPPDA